MVPHMATKQELETAISARLRPGMSREEVQATVGDFLRKMFPAPEVTVEDATTDEDAAQRRLKVTMHVKNPPLSWAARMLAEVPGTKLKIARNLELRRYEAQKHVVAACTICGEAFDDGDLVINDGDHADCYLRVEKAKREDVERGRPWSSGLVPKDGWYEVKDSTMGGTMVVWLVTRQLAESDWEDDGDKEPFMLWSWAPGDDPEALTTSFEEATFRWRSCPAPPDGHGLVVPDQDAARGSDDFDPEAASG